ncbi:MAG TPA: pyruvate dehydrogenase (acetyl-transferring) E1 component subunit alpha [Solirubrobacteraceae bacterium]|jgi:pyruvate dehydrogenase E1 component alpha subunit|nr:pyruvate dehydrogenase (acetyl-transferring) E1 component subunit alpha [Solirubrobacteraceae bacterium]
MATRAESKQQELPERETARDWLRQMMLIRRFEERAGQMYAKAKVGGFLHLAIGEEATIVGAVRALHDEDYLISTYRSHGHALARGTSPNNVMAELFGKVDGTSGGRGGSMHIFDAERRFMGGYGIVGGNLPLGAGLALASDYRGTDEVTLCVFGDGASNQGTFGETMNLAALWKLPIVFMVTNNQFGMGTALDRHSAVTDLKVKGESFGVPGVECDGMDVMDTYRVTCEAVRRAREEHQPILIEAETYRFRGHSMADPEEYRTKEQVEEWRKKDPIETFAKRLEDEGMLEEGERERMDEEVVAEIDRAVQFADESEFPTPESLYEHIYVLGNQVKGWYSVDERGEGVHHGEDEAEMGRGARAEGFKRAAKELDDKSTEVDDDTPDRDAEDDETAGGTDRGDLPKESADSDGANQSPGG